MHKKPIVYAHLDHIKAGITLRNSLLLVQIHFHRLLPLSIDRSILAITSTETHTLSQALYSLTRTRRRMHIHPHMASISPPTPPHHKLSFQRLKLQAKRPSYPSPASPFPSHSLFSSISDSTCCRCSNSSSSSSSSDNLQIQWRWDAALQDVVKSTMKRFNSYMNLLREEAKEVENKSTLERERVEKKRRIVMKKKESWIGVRSGFQLGLRILVCI